MMILWIVLIGVAIYYFSQKNDRGIRTFNSQSAEELLKQRYVSGEIDEETYLRMKEALK